MFPQSSPIERMHAWDDDNPSPNIHECGCR
jgi:hypothetical protein